MDLLEDWNNIVSDDVANPNAEDEPDIFDLALLRDFMSRGRGTPVAVALSGDTLVVATSRNFLLRADLSDGGQASVVEIDLQRPGDAVCRQVWLDPLGSHCLVAASAATGAPETLYVDSAWKKARILSKMKGMALTAVAWWPSLQPSHTTRPVLLGTDSGTLVSLDLADPRKERVQPLHSLQGQSVHSVEQTVSPATGKLLVLALTPSHIHCFHGEGSLQDCFSDTIGSPTGLELPSAPGPTQMTLLFGEPDPAAASRSNAGPEGALLSQPSGIAVLCPDGIFQATLQPDAPGLASDPSAALTRHHLLPLDVVWPGGRAALSLAATRFHFALLSAAALTLVNRVSKRRVQDLVLSRYAAPLRDVAELPLGLVPDTQRGGRVCLWAGDDLFELDAGSEDRDMWRTFLDAGEFGAALLHCSTAAQRSAVFLAQGEAAVEGGDWEAAGTLFGKVTLTEPSFEDLALRFMDAAQPGALQRFLQVRLETLGRDDQVQATMVATWLLELLLDKQNRAALGASEDTGEGAGAGGASELEQVEAELAAFLRKHVRVLDAGTTTSLLSGYGQPGLLEVFAASRGDHETVLELLVQQGQGHPRTGGPAQPGSQPRAGLQVRPRPGGPGARGKRARLGRGQPAPGPRAPTPGAAGAELRGARRCDVACRRAFLRTRRAGRRRRCPGPARPRPGPLLRAGRRRRAADGVPADGTIAAGAPAVRPGPGAATGAGARPRPRRGGAVPGPGLARRRGAAGTDAGSRPGGAGGWSGRGRRGAEPPAVAGHCGAPDPGLGGSQGPGTGDRAGDLAAGGVGGPAAHRGRAAPLPRLCGDRCLQGRPVHGAGGLQPGDRGPEAGDGGVQ
ncbi:VPS18 [Auxenochlorella protothecoides x Auxenochlorella symbiontica]